MNCETSLTLLSDLYDGSLDEADSVRVRTHLDGCQPCLEVFKDLEVIIKASTGLCTTDGVLFPDETAIWSRISIAIETKG